MIFDDEFVLWLTIGMQLLTLLFVFLTWLRSGR